MPPRKPKQYSKKLAEHNDDQKIALDLLVPQEGGKLSCAFFDDKTSPGGS